MHLDTGPLASSLAASIALRRQSSNSRVELQRKHIRFVALIAADCAAFGLALGFAMFSAAITSTPLWVRGLHHFATFGAHWHGWGIFSILSLVLLHFGGQGHYTQRNPFWTGLRQIVLASAYALGCDFVISNVLYGIPFGLESALRWSYLAPAILFCRSIARAILSHMGIWTINALILSEEGDIESVRAALDSDPSLGYKIVGHVNPNSLSDVSSPSSWRQLAESRAVQFFIIAGHFNNLTNEVQMVAALNLSHVAFGRIPAIEAAPMLLQHPQQIFSHDVTLLTYQNNLAQPYYQLLKISFDVLVALALIVLAAPLLALIALLIKLDGGPVLFRHKRVGANGRAFFCFKFRSMRQDAEQALTELLAGDPMAQAEWDECQKLWNDPRVTTIGSFLRRTSLDELPQLFNVLRGEMSLIGPRPIVNSEISRYGDDIAYYYATRPGVTGLWQVSGRSDASYQKRVRLDVWYVRNWSLWHDIVILLKTIPVLLLRRGAV